MPRDERTFITVHDGMPEHPKIEGLSDAAFRLMIEAWCWCSRNRTDGRIVDSSWRKRGTAKARAELLAARLVEPATDGVYVHDYTQHQRTAAEIDALSAKRREAGSKGGKSRASALASATGVAKQTASKSVAETETETEELQQLGGVRPVTLQPAHATAPTPNEARCTAHQGVADPGPCKGCQAARERLERLASRDTERAQRASEERARNCPDCEGTHFILDAEKRPTRRKCEHRRTA